MRITTVKNEKRVRRNKRKYRLQNWNDYNKGLKKRGDITLRINPDTLKQWQYKPVGYNFRIYFLVGILESWRDKIIIKPKHKACIRE